MLARSSITSLGAALLLISASAANAREWRGIVPLRSTRADVIRRLNQCADQREACRFTTESEDVHILFSGGLTAEHRECAGALPPETVMLIDIEPRGELKLRDLHLDKRRLYYFDGSRPAFRDFEGYNTNDGLLVTLHKHKVVKMVYLPAEVNTVPCSDYYQRPESFAQIPLVHVPIITSFETQETIKAGDKLRVTAHSNANETRGYTWSINAGKIVAGQYTKEVTIDTTGLEGQTIIVSAEIGYLGHFAISSCRVRVVRN